MSRRGKNTSLIPTKGEERLLFLLPTTYYEHHQLCVCTQCLEHLKPVPRAKGELSPSFSKISQPRLQALSASVHEGCLLPQVQHGRRETSSVQLGEKLSNIQITDEATYNCTLCNKLELNIQCTPSYILGNTRNKTNKRRIFHYWYHICIRIFHNL